MLHSFFYFREWYVHTTRNDLNYWGLDYPPLTAYHSYAIGRLFAWLLPESVALHTSHGFESPLHKFLMRASVSISDILLPALLVFHFLIKPNNQETRWHIGKKLVIYETIKVC